MYYLMKQHKIFRNHRKIILQIIMILGLVTSTVDINVPQMKYLANNLRPEECRRLVAALHYKSYNQPNSLDVAEDKVSEDIPCINLLLHWNSATEEGKGETHEMLFRRLRQIGRDDLAEWLGKSVFHELGQDLKKSMENPFNEIEKEDTNDEEDKLNDEPHKQDNTLLLNWTVPDTISWIIILSLCFLTTAIIAKTVSNFCKQKKIADTKRNYGKYRELETRDIISDTESEDKFDVREKDDQALNLMGLQKK